MQLACWAARVHCWLMSSFLDSVPVMIWNQLVCPLNSFHYFFSAWQWLQESDCLRVAIASSSEKYSGNSSNKTHSGVLDYTTHFGNRWSRRQGGLTTCIQSWCYGLGQSGRSSRGRYHKTLTHWQQPTPPGFSPQCSPSSYSLWVPVTVLHLYPPHIQLHSAPRAIYNWKSKATC